MIRGFVLTASIAAVAVILLLLPACASTTTEQPQPDRTQDRQQVEAAAKRIWNAVGSNDAAATLAEYADDAIIFPEGMPMVRGKQSVTNYVQGIFSAVTFKDVTGTLIDVRVSGDLAVETGTVRWTLVPRGGASIEDRVKYLHVWERTRDGSWKVIRYFANSDIAPAS